MHIRKIIREELEKHLEEDVFAFDELTSQEQEDAYNIFKSSYEKTTGKAWTKMKFYQRASNWTFYGIKSKGFIVVKPDFSGFNKISGVAGDIKAVGLGIKELSMTNQAIWGAADKKMVDVLTARYNFLSPPSFLVKAILKRVPSYLFGDATYEINPDGSITFDYEDVGKATKYFFANKQFFDKIAPGAVDMYLGSQKQ
jgi:hypothetical protein